MLKRILMLATVISLVSGATFAYFSATADSSGNVVTAGTLGFGSPVDATWTSGNMAPGDTLTGNYSMDNAGTIDADHLEIATANTGGSGDLHEVLEVDKMLYGYDSDNDGDVNDESVGNTVDIIAVIVSGVSDPGGNPTAATQDAQYNLTLETAVNGSTNVAQLDANNDNKITLKELAAGVIEITKSGEDAGLKAGRNAGFYAKISLPSSVGNPYQGKTNTLTWTYTLNQHSSQ